MSKYKGFTLIEMLFILQIICILEILILPYANKKIELSDIIIQNIFLVIENARLDAINLQKTIYLEFSNHTIYQDNIIIYENPNVTFENPKVVGFNKEGHIQQPKTIYFSININEYHLIFNLGQGVYRIEEK